MTRDTDFETGDRVVHSSYGPARIVDTDPKPNSGTWISDYSVRVQFDSNRSDHIIDSRDLAPEEVDG
jgi:hypothetical protein